VRSDLVTAARSHSTTMARQGVLSHSSLSGICCFKALAENVGAGATVGAVHTALMGSSGHRANILNPAMRHVGVGVVSSGGTLWVTEIFRVPVNGSAADLTAPAKKKTAVRPGSATRASRSTARQARSAAALLKSRIARLSHRAPPRNRDPLVSALAWSAAMRELTASR
jgi:Cysteine-rich secretory protein family